MSNLTKINIRSIESVSYYYYYYYLRLNRD